MKLIASYLIDKVTTITTYCLSVRSSAYSIGKIKESQGILQDFRPETVDCSQMLDFSIESEAFDGEILQK